MGTHKHCKTIAPSPSYVNLSSRIFSIPHLAVPAHCACTPHMYDFYGRLTKLPLCTTGNQSSRYDMGSCCSLRHRQMKLNSGGCRNTQWIVVFLKTQQSTMCFENKKHGVVQPATADARVLRLAAVRGDLPLQQRVIFTVSTIISTVDSYQYCSKPVVE